MPKVYDPLTSNRSTGYSEILQYINTQNIDPDYYPPKTNPVQNKDSLEIKGQDFNNTSISKPKIPTPNICKYNAPVTITDSTTNSSELPLDIETIVYLVYDLVRQGLNDSGKLDRDLLIMDQDKKKILNKKRLDELDEMAKKSKHGKFWNIFHKIAAASGLILCAATGIGATINVAAIVAWCIGASLVIDDLADDIGKKTIAQQLANLLAPALNKDPSELTDAIENYLELASGLAIAGISISTANVEGISKSVQGVTGTLQASFGAGKAINQHSQNNIRQSSQITQLDLSNLQDRFKGFCDDNGELLNNLSNIFKNKNNIESTKQQVSVEILRAGA